ncbi:MAG: large subunit ribosomal protein L15 [Parcubacteria group bacterium Licking1014_17]|nr:MAG: large subunit ribosomal protein L15 [Parcubacteria group bacterium Licking1014_17]
MQLHEVKSTTKRKYSKRVGRGGKRGTYSGHGSKGQKSRAGHRIRPGFRGGDNPIWKLFPKQKGAGKKTEAKHRTYWINHAKPAVINLSTIDKFYKAGESVTKENLLKRGIISTGKHGVKILGDGKLTKKLNFSGVKISASAGKKIAEAGGSVAE